MLDLPIVFGKLNLFKERNKMTKELTTAQLKMKRLDEIACRVSLAIALVAFIYAIVTK